MKRNFEFKPWHSKEESMDGFDDEDLEEEEDEDPQLRELIDLLRELLNWLKGKKESGFQQIQPQSRM